MAKAVKKTKKPERTYRLDLVYHQKVAKKQYGLPVTELRVERNYRVRDIKKVQDMLSCMDEELGFIELIEKIDG